MHVDRINHRAARPVQLSLGGIRARSETSLGARRSNQFGGAYRGAARCIDLIWVMQFNDFHRFKIFGCGGGEGTGQHRSQRKVWCDQHTNIRSGPQ